MSSSQLPWHRPMVKMYLVLFPTNVIEVPSLPTKGQSNKTYIRPSLVEIITGPPIMGCFGLETQ